MLRSLSRLRPRSSLTFRTLFTPSRPMRMAEAVPEQKSKINLRFATPSAILFSEASVNAPPKHTNNLVDMVLIPSSEGVMGVLPNFPPTIAQIVPGVVTVQESADKPVIKYFTSGGFATVRADSTVSITAAEAVPLEDIDPQAVAATLESNRNVMERSTDPVEKATAQIAFETATLLQHALDSK